DWPLPAPCWGRKRYGRRGTCTGAGFQHRWAPALVLYGSAAFVGRSWTRQDASIEGRGMGRLFGTDGVRGLANESLSPELALRVAGAAAQALGRGRTRPLALVGRDPRASGEMLEAAVTAGLTAAGVDVLSVGVLPTPAVAYLTGLYDACLGVMISASHNPMPDNGIKIFAAGGRKLDDAIEDKIEALMDEPAVRPTGAGIGRVLSSAGVSDHGLVLPEQYSVAGTHERYVEHLVEATGHELNGLTVVVDCAHGAA